MAKNIAVKGCTLQGDPPISGGSFSISTPESTTVKADGKGVYKGSIAFTISGGTFSGNSIQSGSGSIMGTSVKNKDGGVGVVLEGDSGPISGVFTNPAPPPPSLPFVGTVKVSDAGQSKVKEL